MFTRMSKFTETHDKLKAALKRIDEIYPNIEWNAIIKRIRPEISDGYSDDITTGSYIVTGTDKFGRLIFEEAPTKNRSIDNWAYKMHRKGDLTPKQEYSHYVFNDNHEFEWVNK